MKAATIQFKMKSGSLVTITVKGVAMNEALYNLRGPLSVEETGADDFAHVPHRETETAPMS
ncbi:hypothetical protein GC173_11450 [bacterium]|nr:hypothetical protein [bacterium]